MTNAVLVALLEVVVDMRKSGVRDDEEAAMEKRALGVVVLPMDTAPQLNMEKIVEEALETVLNILLWRELIGVVVPQSSSWAIEVVVVPMLKLPEFPVVNELIESMVVADE